MNWSIRRFPQQGALPVLLIVVITAFLAIMGFRIVLAPLDDDIWWTHISLWQQAVLPMWVLAFGTGLSLIAYYLRLHVAHGRTRRDFMRQATGYLLISAAALAAVTALGFVLEAAIYRANGWDYVMGYPEYATRSTADFFIVFARLWLEFGMWIVTGMLVTAGFRRFRVVGLLLTIPLALAMIVLTTDGVGTSSYLGPSPLWNEIALWSSIPVVLLGLAASWALTRKIAV